MTPDSVFQAANTIALLAWLLLVSLGWKRWIREIVCGVAVPAVLALLYVALIVLHWGEGQGSFGSLSGVETLFTNRWLLLAGWVHYLAFDLFVGSWEVRNAVRTGIPHWMVIPCLIATFLFGPVGFALYLVLRFVLRQRFAISDGASLPARTY